jgi:hypothetical protein
MFRRLGSHWLRVAGIGLGLVACLMIGYTPEGVAQLNTDAKKSRKQTGYPIQFVVSSGYAPVSAGAFSYSDGRDSVVLDRRRPNDSIVVARPGELRTLAQPQFIPVHVGVQVPLNALITVGAFGRAYIPVGRASYETDFSLRSTLPNSTLPLSYTHRVDISFQPTFLVGVRALFFITPTRLAPYIPAEFSIGLGGIDWTNTLTYRYSSDAVSSIVENRSSRQTDYYTGTLGIGVQYGLDDRSDNALFLEAGLTLVESLSFGGNGVARLDEPLWTNYPYRSWQYERGRFLFYFKFGVQLYGFSLGR